MVELRVRKPLTAVLAVGLVTVLAGCAHAQTGEAAAATILSSSGPGPTTAFATSSPLVPLLGAGTAAPTSSITAVAIRPISAHVGQTLDIKVKVKVYGTTGSGGVVILDGGTVLQTLPLAWAGESGTAEMTIPLPAGTHRIMAHYSGDGQHLGSTSVPVTVAVARIVPQVSVAAALVPKTTDKYRLAVAVRTHTKSLSATGSVTLVVGGVSYPLVLDGTGHAHVTVLLTHGVQYVANVYYPGDANLTSGTASAVFVG